MWYLYLDESGDLGFDFFGKGPSNFFTVAILAIRGESHNRSLINAVKKTTLNKRQVYESLAQKKDRVYNFIARNVLDHVPIEEASPRVILVIDRSKSRREVGEFNDYIIRQLEGRIDPKVPLAIFHHRSQENLGPQAADLFSWGIFRKYERRDQEWYTVFREKIRYEDRYL